MGDHGVSPHLVSIFQKVYFQQCGKIVGSMEDSFEFDIAGGVQGCVLSPRLSCSIPEWALSEWRARCNGVGFGIPDGEVSLFDVRFADGILTSTKSHEERGQALDMLVDNLRYFGLVLNAAETKISTRQNQHPENFYLQVGYLGKFSQKTKQTNAQVV